MKKIIILNFYKHFTNFLIRKCHYFFLYIVSMYLRFTPIEYGRWRLLRKSRKIATSLYPINRNIIMKTRHDFIMKVDLDDYVTQEIYLSGEYEPEVTSLVKAILARGDVFVDIGANVGYFSLLASKIVGDEGSVYAYEPIFYDKLKDNIDLNLSKCIINPIALSNLNKDETMYKAPQTNSGMSALREVDGASKINVKTYRFDKVFSQSIKPKLIKIDVEGAEQRVLEGMGDILNIYCPDIIVEITDAYLRQLGSSSLSLSSFLIEKGYQMFKISGKTLTPICLKSLSENNDYQFNAYFTTSQSYSENFKNG